MQLREVRRQRSGDQQDRSIQVDTMIKFIVDGDKEFGKGKDGARLLGHFISRCHV